MSIFLLILSLSPSQVYGQNQESWELVKDTEVGPHKFIVQITTVRSGLKREWKLWKQDKTSSFIETGFFVSPRIILTSAHNMHSSVWSRVKSITLTPGKNRDAIPYGRKVLNFKTAKDYQKHVKVANGYNFIKDDICDEYAFIILPDENFYNQIFKEEGDKPFRLGVFDKLVTPSTTLHLCGYPAESKDGQAQWYQKGSFSEKKSCSFSYNLQSEKGNSGSPIWVEKDGEYHAVGIHEGTVGIGRAYKIGKELIDLLSILKKQN